MSNPEISSITLLSGNTYYFKDEYAREKIAQNAIPIGDDAPESPIDGSLWIDTSQSNILKFYRDGEWLPVGSAWGDI